MAALLLAAGHAAADGTLVYSAASFGERWQNDGGIVATITVTLTNQNDNFSGANGNDFVSDGKVVTTNVPAGLTAIATRTATNKVVLSFAGKAISHTSASNITDLAFVFKDAAFSNGPASSVTWAAGTNLAVTFLAQNASNWYVSAAGSDATGNGTQGSPWRTVTNALAKAQSDANDVINVGPGTYTNAATISVGKVVTIQGSNREDTILQPSDLPFTVENIGIFTYTKSGVLRNLTLRHGRRPTGGAVDGGNNNLDLMILGCRFSYNAATNTFGGAVYLNHNAPSPLLTIADTEFVGNTARTDGGAVRAYSHQVAISNCVFVGNSATNEGGAVMLAASSRFAVLANTLMISNRTQFGSGGALLVGLNRPVGMDRCTFAYNVAGSNGGACHLDVKAAMVLTNSTFYGNACGQSPIGFGSGGAIWHFDNAGAAAGFYNSTFFGNRAPSGGAVRAYQAIRFVSSIVASNTATSGFGPDLLLVTSSTTATNSLISNNANAGTDNSIKFGLPNSFGNYVGNALTNAVAGLAPLAWNGGLQPTCALLPDSVAIDHGLNPLGLTTDARGPGYARVVGAQADMGAYEYGAVPPVMGTAILLR
jgi:hypothetical protein